MASTSIEWSDAVWNPTVGCSRVSKGCEHCYAERVAHRGMSPQHRGLTVLGRHGPRWNGKVNLVAEKLDEPTRWRKPRRVFVNSMSDLFHEAIPFEFILDVFRTMALPECQRHTFQLLTKRPERAMKFFESLRGLGPTWPYPEHDELALPNVWLGVSAEDQSTADERIPVLLQCPAAVRWVSYEPALGPVDFTSLDVCGQGPTEALHPYDPIVRLDALRGRVRGPDDVLDARLDWIVAGSESGPGARPADLAWYRSVRDQCQAAGVAFFLKQHAIGGRKQPLPVLDGRRWEEMPRA